MNASSADLERGALYKAVAGGGVPKFVGTFLDCGILTERVQLKCHYGIRSQKPYHIWFFQL